MAELARQRRVREDGASMDRDERGDEQAQASPPGRRRYGRVSANPVLAEAREAYWPTAAALLRELRDERGWTQQDLAQRAGVSYGLVAAYEQGEKRHPALTEVMRLLTALGLDWAVFNRLVEQRSGASLTADVTRPAIAEGPRIDPARLYRRLGRIEDRLAALEATVLADPAPDPFGGAPVGAGADRSTPPRTPASAWEPRLPER